VRGAGGMLAHGDLLRPARADGKPQHDLLDLGIRVLAGGTPCLARRPRSALDGLLVWDGRNDPLHFWPAHAGSAGRSVVASARSCDRLAGARRTAGHADLGSGGPHDLGSPLLLGHRALQVQLHRGQVEPARRQPLALLPHHLLCDPRRAGPAVARPAPCVGAGLSRSPLHCRRCCCPPWVTKKSAS